MSVYVISNVSQAAYALAVNDSLYITRLGSLVEPGYIRVAGSTYIHVDGAALCSISAPTTAGWDADINVTSQGTISAYNGLYLNTTLGGTFALANAGSITATNYGVISYSTLASVTNSGSIVSSLGTALRIDATSGAVVNTGHIAGYADGVQIFAYSPTSTSTTPTLELHNTGDIVAGKVAVRGFINSEKVYNAGVIQGDVDLGDGADVIDTSAGVILGRIIGGQGNDTITGSARGDTIYGDNPSGDTTGGTDVLYGGFGDDILNGGYGNDFLYGNQDNDQLYGNQGDDWMHGGQGNDSLFGGQGNDTLNGGIGDDVLAGNLGNDTFVFSGPGFGHDTITDFGVGADVIQVSTDIFSDFAAVQAHAVAVSNGTLLTDNAGDTILLIGISPGALTAAMFAFG